MTSFPFCSFCKRPAFFLPPASPHTWKMYSYGSFSAPFAVKLFRVKMRIVRKLATITRPTQPANMNERRTCKKLSYFCLVRGSSKRSVLFWDALAETSLQLSTLYFACTAASSTKRGAILKNSNMTFMMGKGPDGKRALNLSVNSSNDSYIQ